MASPGGCTTEFFLVFHYTERAFYTLIVMSLSRDPTEAMKVLAFCLWLEQAAYVFKNTVPKFRDFPHRLINAAVGEIFPFGSNPVEIPNIQGLCEGDYKNLVSVIFFHSNRLVVILGLVEFFNNVCLSAFGDMAQQAIKLRQAQAMRTSHASTSSSNGKASLSNAMQHMIILMTMGPPLYIEDPMAMAARANGKASSSTRADVEAFLPSQADAENARAMALVPVNGEGSRAGRAWDYIQK